MDDVRIGSALRGIRHRKRLRQADLAVRAGITRWHVSQVELGYLETAGLPALRNITRALGARLDITVRWQGGDLDRMLNSRHAALHETVAQLFSAIGGWQLWPEASFSVYGERGIVDLLAWHPRLRALLVVELKSDIVDVSELLGTLDRKRRLAPGLAAERGWEPASVSVWLAVDDRRANRGRLALHATVLRAALPTDGRTMRRWLREPAESVAALSFLHCAGPAGTMTNDAGRRRVRTGGRSRTKSDSCTNRRSVDGGSRAEGRPGGRFST